MDSPESVRGFLKQEVGGSDVKSDRVGDDDWEGGDRKKHKSSRSRKFGNMEEVDGLDGSGRRKNSGDKGETRKRASGSSRADSDDNDYDSRKDSRSKQVKKKQEESTLQKLSSLYQDGESDKLDGGDNKMGSGVHNRADESERRKMSIKHLEYDTPQNRSRNNEEKLHDELGSMDKDHKVLEKRESGREKGHGSSDQVRSSRRKWDEADTIRKIEDDYSLKGDVGSGMASDPRYESSRERSASTRNELGEVKARGPDSSDKVVKSNNREERRADFERTKSKGKLESQEFNREDRLERDRNDKLRHQRSATSYDERWDKSLNVDEDGMHGKDKTSREVGHTNRSRTPERSGKHHPDSENSGIDYERSSSFKRKEFEKDGYKDGKNKDRESSKESWRRRQSSNTDKESTNSDIGFDHNRVWELPRYGRERGENERPHGRSGGRKDGSRGEAVKTSSNFGISNDNYDVIEIQTKPIDYGKAESVSNFYEKNEVNQQYDTKSGANDEQWSYLHENKSKKSDLYGAGTPSEELKERYTDDDYDIQGGRGRSQKGAVVGRSSGGQSSSSGGSHSQHGNQESGSYNRAGPHGVKGNRVGQGGRVRPTGRDNQVGMPLPVIGSPFGPLGMPPPGPMQSLTPGMSPAPGPPIPPGVFIPPFSASVWPGARGVDMNILAVPPGLSPMPPGGPRFPTNLGNPPNPAMYYNQGPGRGVAPNISGPSFDPRGQMTRGASSDKSPGGWAPPKSGGTPGKAPSRGEQNDYSQNFVDTGMRPQNFIRELELTNVVEDYPKLRELIQKKDEIVAKSASAPMYFKCDLKEFELSPEFFGTKFDVILVDPPWEEYVHRAPGVADHMEYWTFEEIMNLKIEAIADTPSFIFLWVGDGVGLEQGRQCLKKWGFRRCEDICWVKTNKNNATPGLRHDSYTLFQHSKEHCLMGIKGTVRRSTDGHIIHANIDTDVIIAEEPLYGSTQKPDDMYRVIEHFALGKRRLELFGEDHNIRAGWVTVGKGLSSSNFNAEAYTKNFADKDGKVWQGGGGRNPPPEAPHLVLTTPDIETLRPKSPMKNQQQQSVSISLTSNSSNRRAAGNSPQNPTALGLNQEGTPWASPLDGFKGREDSLVPSDDNKVFDIYGYNGPPGYLDFESYRQMNML